jgi:hypothetical protein
VCSWSAEALGRDKGKERRLWGGGRGHRLWGGDRTQAPGVEVEDVDSEAGGGSFRVGDEG